MIMSNDSMFTDLGSLLTGIVKKKQWQQRLGLHQVFLFWDKAVGKEIAAHAQPKVIKGTVLWLKVSDSVWAQQLQFEKLTILDEINGRLVKIGTAKFGSHEGKKIKLTDLRFDISSGPLKSIYADNGKRKVPSVPEADLDALAHFNQMIIDIEDPRIKQSMRRLWQITEARKHKIL